MKLFRPTSLSTHRGLVLTLIIVVAVALIGIVAVNVRLGSPNTTQREDIKQAQEEASSMFGGSGIFEPQNATYNCNLMTKAIGGCYINISSQYTRNESAVNDSKKYIEQLPSLLLANGWIKYNGQYNSPEVTKESSGGTKVDLAYTKTVDKMYCELSFRASYDTMPSSSAEPAG